MVESELGKIPEGWKTVPLKKIVNTQYGFTQSAKEKKIGPKFLRVKDINKTAWINWSDVPYCRIKPSEYEKYQLKVGDILIARMADPGKIAIVEQNMDAVFASYLIRLKINSKRVKPYYLFYFLNSQRFQGIILGASSGTTRRNINATQIGSLPFLSPSRSVVNSYQKEVSVMRRQLVNNVKENNILANIRDSLLPRLMSGRLRVK